MAKRRGNTPYGGAHQEKAPFKLAVGQLFRDYMKKMSAVQPTTFHDSVVNNLMIELRNEVYSSIDQLYQTITIKSKHGLSLEANVRRSARKPRQSLLTNQRCVICGEERCVNLCHVIPREVGGRDSDDNFIILCPTHHFLFDESRLSEIELGKIQLANRPSDVVDYFQMVRVKRQRMFWRYGTNKFGGCTCGSQELSFGTIRNGGWVQICLTCKSCREKWLNLWTESHPITKASILVYDVLREKVAKDDLENRFTQAETLLRTYIHEHHKSS